MKLPLPTTPRSIALATGVLFTLVVLLCIRVYIPGLFGPFVFDDYANLLYNDYIKLRSLDLEQLKRAAFSLKSGPLQRPVTMVSFALNHYFAGGLFNSFHFKATNLAIHLINGLLIFWLVYILLARFRKVYPDHFLASLSLLQTRMFALSVMALWLLHPMQLTSVLYIVQRMASLSALFVLFGTIAYLQGRTALPRNKGAALAWFGGAILAFILGIYSKENAVLLIVFIGLVELLLFAQQKPWRAWQDLGARQQRTVFIVFAVVGVLLAWAAVQYGATGFGSRPFSQWERVLTESRVLLFYISLMVIPRLNRFGVYHDDYTLSTGLLTPPTTLISIIVIIGLLLLAMRAQRRHAMLTLGILWYFAAHSLESTVLSLEIIHEHRNYVASLGVFLALVYLVFWGFAHFRKGIIYLVIPALLFLFSANTYVRAQQWTSYYRLTYFSAVNHPKSPRAHIDFAAALHGVGKYREAVKALRYAASLDPEEPGYYINMHMSAIPAKITLPPEERQRLLQLLKRKHYSIFTNHALYKVHECVRTGCKSLAKPLEQWTRLALQYTSNRAYYDYMLGRALAQQKRYRESAFHLRRSHKLDPQYLHPLFDLFEVYMETRQYRKAGELVAYLKQRNKTVKYPRVRETRRLEQRLQQATQGRRSGRR